MGRPQKVTSQPGRGKSNKKNGKKKPQPVSKRYKPKLSFNETFFRALIEHNINAITLLNEIGEVIYDSPAASGMLGYSPTEWLGKSVFQLVHPDDLPKIHRLFENLLKKKGTQSQAIFRIRHKENRWLWIDAIATNLLHKPNVKAIIVNYRDVTQIKQAEETLSEIEERFKQVWEVTTDAMALSDAQGIVIAANPAYYNLYGYKPEQVIGQKFSIIFPPDIRGYAEEQYEKLFQSDVKPTLFESVIQRADGTERIVESTASFLTSAGKRVAMLSVIRDITERKAADARIQNERNFSNQALDSLPGVFYMFDKSMKFVRWNKNFETVTGYTAEEIAGMSPLDFFAAEEKKLISEKIEEVFHNGVAWVEANFVSKNGKRTPYYFTGKVFESEGVTYLIGTGIDISARKQAEKTLQTQNARLKVLREIDIAILSADTVENIVEAALSHIRELVDCQRASLALINWEAGEGIIFNVSADDEAALTEGTRAPLSLFQEMNEKLLENQPVLIHDLTALPNPPALFQAGIQAGFRSVCVLPLFSQNKLFGAFSLSSKSVGFFDEEKVALGREVANQVAIAITQNNLLNELRELNATLEKRVAERTAQLNQTNLELEHANRAKDEFLANMSHELRTPLNSILGLTESMLEQYQETLNENQQKSLQIIEASGKHLLELINDILDISKLESGMFDYYPQLIRAIDLCKSSLIFVKSQASKKNITLSYEIAEDLSPFYADPRRLKQILVNLLSNAVKFTPNHGHVALLVNADAEQEIIQFSVLDDGIGISQENLRKLFQPFVQVESGFHRPFEGTGLGLAIVHKLTDLHGGSVEVESEVGKGSRFTIKLPYRRGELGQEKEAQSAVFQPRPVEAQYQPKAAGVRQKILLAEDNQTNVLTIGEYLENYGYQIIVANDGLQALEKAQTVLPDVILMDIQMPAMDGLEAMRRLRSDVRFASTPIIALTALAMPGDRERCLEAGATEYMSKPVSLKELRKTIEGFMINK